VTYSLLDSGNQDKLERFGDYILVRPCAQAVWRPALPEHVWKAADAKFTREQGNRWNTTRSFPASWDTALNGLTFKVVPTDFGHVGLFPEHASQWSWMEERIREAPQRSKVLNLFAYTGGATLAAARAGADVCHLDASRASVAWARENAARNSLQDRPIRWIIEDVVKFLHRELKRAVRYDGIILDPPSFGRGCQGEVFKIERDLQEILQLSRRLLSDRPLFVIFTSHTPGFSPLVMQHLLQQTLHGLNGVIEVGEMVLPIHHQEKGSSILPVPSGTFARWRHA
jgi:23S rRNA (cytosine1962-C5)-methyltransferase